VLSRSRRTILHDFGGHACPQHPSQLLVIHRSRPRRSIDHRIPHPSGVHRRSEVPRALLRLADCQSGVLTREQVLGHDLGSSVVARLIRSGIWQRLGNGLYLTHPLEPSWEALAWGGILLGGPRARLGPEASGYQHGLIPHAPDPVDVLVPVDKLIQSRHHWRFHRERSGARHGRSFGSPPRLAVEDAVLDLANARAAAEVVGLVTMAVQRRMTTPDRLRSRLDQRSRHAHRALLIGMLADVAEGAESPLELDFLRRVERPHGLPRGDRQNSRTGLRYIRDVLYEEFGLLIELDGRDGHQDIGRFRDMNRDNLHALRNELTLRFGWFDVTARACSVAFQVFTVLNRRGYNSPFRRCTNCRTVPEAHLLSA
jgi:hypothetical protein